MTIMICMLLRGGGNQMWWKQQLAREQSYDQMSGKEDTYEHAPRTKAGWDTFVDVWGGIAVIEQGEWVWNLDE